MIHIYRSKGKRGRKGMEEQTNRWEEKDRWTEEQVNGRMARRRWMDGQTDRWMDCKG